MIDVCVWLENNHTCPSITDFIIHALQDWQNGEQVTPLIAYTFNDVTIIFQSQKEIGQPLYTSGCISLHWVRVQQQYLVEVGSRISDKRWAT